MDIDNPKKLAKIINLAYKNFFKKLGISLKLIPSFLNS